MVALTACAAVPHVWDRATGEVDCPLRTPVLATVATALLATAAAGEFYSAAHPTPQTYNQNGVDTSYFTPGPDLDRAMGYAAVGASVLTAAVSTIAWTGYARCRRVDDRMQAMVAARDCATVVRLDGELASIDASFRDAELDADPRITDCMIAHGLGPVGASSIEASTNPIVNRFTSAARRSALAGDCDSVKGFAARVRRFAPDYYDRVFVHDQTIATCSAVL